MSALGTRRPSAHAGRRAQRSTAEQSSGRAFTACRDAEIRRTKLVTTAIGANGVARRAGMAVRQCDMRVRESARFSTGYVRVGLVPGDGDHVLLPRLSARQALELLWTADFIEAPEATGSAHRAHSRADAQRKDATYRWRAQIADGPRSRSG